MASTLVLGIDVGTQGARALAADERGRTVAQAAASFEQAALPHLPPGHIEQNPDDWWRATRACLRSIVGQLRERGRDARDCFNSA